MEPQNQILTPFQVQELKKNKQKQLFRYSDQCDVLCQKPSNS